MKSRISFIRDIFPSHTATTERDFLFPREQHPDTRSAQEFFRDMAMKQYLKKLQKKPKRTNFFTISKPVVCVTTGETFVSVTAAANAHGINKGIVSKHINNNTAIHGLVFRFQ